MGTNRWSENRIRFFLYKTSEGSFFHDKLLLQYSRANVRIDRLQWYLPIQKRFYLPMALMSLGLLEETKLLDSTTDTNFNVITFTSNLTGFSVGSGPV